MDSHKLKLKDKMQVYGYWKIRGNTCNTKGKKSTIESESFRKLHYWKGGRRFLYVIRWWSIHKIRYSGLSWEALEFIKDLMGEEGRMFESNLV